MSGGIQNATGVPANDVTCDPSVGILISCSLSERLLDTSYVTKNLFKWEHLLYIVLMFVFLLLARVTYQAKLWCYRTKSASPSEADGTERPVNNPNTCGGQFAYQLTDKDNKAVATSFAGYMFAVGLILWASLTDLTDNQGKNIGYIVEWQAIGVALLELARVVNDKVLLSSQSGEAKFDNTSELLKENRAVGAAEAGSYVATGLVIMAAVSGPPGVWWQDIVSTLIWFVMGQLAFVIFAFVINTKVVTRFNFMKEIKQGNVAAGVLFGLELVAIGNLVSNSVLKSDSFITFGVWYLLGGIVLIVVRYLVDYVIIPSRSLNDEIQQDQNLGAAILVGGIPIGLTFVINTFLPDTCLNPT